MSTYHLIGYQRYTVNFCDEQDRLSDLGPWSEAGVFNTDAEARGCLMEYLTQYPTIYKWEIILSQNGIQSVIAKGGDWTV